MRDYRTLRADFIAAPTSGLAPLTVFLTNTTPGQYTDSLWSFGDGLTSALQNPIHTYTAPGVYTVSLRVTEATSSPGSSDTLTRANYISVSAPPCTELIANGSFEVNAVWETDGAYHAAYSAANHHSGSRSLRVGIVNPDDNVRGDSIARQTLSIPANAQSVTLRFWLYTAIFGSGPDDSDVQRVLIQDPLGNPIQTLLAQHTDMQMWTLYEFDLSGYTGESIRLVFDVYNNGTGNVTAMYVDDVSVQACPAQ
jgi:PKD repeat protein